MHNESQQSQHHRAVQLQLQLQLQALPDWSSCCVKVAAKLHSDMLSALCSAAATAMRHRRLTPAAQAWAVLPPLILTDPLRPATATTAVRSISCCSGCCCTHVTKRPTLQATCCFSMASANCVVSNGAPRKLSCSWLITMQQLDRWAACSAVRAAGGVCCKSRDMIGLLSSAFNLRAASSACFMRRAGLMLAGR
jgi:hypothetical protein